MRIVFGSATVSALLALTSCTQGGQSGTDQQDVEQGDDDGAADDDVTDDDVADDDVPDDAADDDVATDDDVTDDDAAGDDVTDDDAADDDVTDDDAADDDATDDDATDDDDVADDDANDDDVADDDGPAAGGAANGGNNAGGSAGAGGFSSQGGSNTGGQGGGTSSPDSVCAPEPPEPGSPCEEPWASSAGIGLAYAHCSWGDDPRPLCRTLATCSNGNWVVNTPTDARCETAPLSEACPAEPPTSGAVCGDATVDCWYPEGDHCLCSECQGGSGYPICVQIDPPEWACPETPAECPSRIPQAGSVCAQPGSSCGPDCELQVVCEDSVWQWNQGNCPICAAPNTQIATPMGERDISSIAVGDLVYSVNAGAIEVVPVLRVESTPVVQHQVMQVTLQSGAVLEISPGHPTAYGRLFGDLQADDWLDEQHRVIDTRLVPYTFDRTYDILPASDSGTYFASGALVGSTLFSPLGGR
jgi:hypothetical protein